MTLTDRREQWVASVWKPAVFVIVIGISLFIIRQVFAASIVTPYYVIPARPTPNATSTVLYHLHFAQAFAPSSRIVLALDALDVPAAATPSDGLVTLDGNAQTLAGSSGVDTYGYAYAAGHVTFTLPSNVGISANSDLELLVGREEGFHMQNATGSVAVAFDLQNSQGQTLESHGAAFAVLGAVSLSATFTPTNPQIQVLKIKPELRAGAPGTNDDAAYYLTADYAATFYGTNNQPSPNNITSVDRKAPLFTQPQIDTVSQQGYSNTVTTLSGLVDGNYDIAIKTQQHLRRVLREVPLVGGNVTALNFTDIQNGPGDGGQVLLAGDINGSGTDPSSLGDDVINSIDLSLLINDLDGEDPTGNAVRANLNEDTVVNSIDLSIMLKNLDLQGEEL